MLRYFRSCWSALVLAISPFALLAPTPAQAVYNALDAVPAATVLIPYFEVDLSNTNGQTTVVSLVNSSATAMLARVTVWSDHGRPVFNFPIYLTGYDLASINMRDVLNGTLPTTASAGQDPTDTLSPHGPVSQDINYASCTAQVPPVSTLDSLPLATMSALKLADVRAALTGTAVANATLTGISAGQCVGQSYGDNVARGYITIDTVISCMIGSPVDGENYFNNAIATDQNTLWADYTLVNPSQNFAYGDLGTMIESTDPTPAPGTYTFYGRFVGGRATDKREGLASQWAIHADRDSSQIQYWRDTRIALNPSAVGFVCATSPSPAPMGQDWAGAFNFDSTTDVAFTSGGLFAVPVAKVDLTNANSGMTGTKKIGHLQASLNTTIGGTTDVEFSSPNLTQSVIAAVRKPKNGVGRFLSGAVAFPMDTVAAPSSRFINFPSAP